MYFRVVILFRLTADSHIMAGLENGLRLSNPSKICQRHATSSPDRRHGTARPLSVASFVGGAAADGGGGTIQPPREREPKGRRCPGPLGADFWSSAAATRRLRGRPLQARS